MKKKSVSDKEENKKPSKSTAKKRKSEEDYEIIDFSASDSDSENETLYKISVKNKKLRPEKVSTPSKSNALSAVSQDSGKKLSPKSKGLSGVNNKGTDLNVDMVKKETGSEGDTSQTV